MKSVYFDEELSKNDLFFMCYMIERVARKLHQRNVYVVETIGYDELIKKISLASVLHCQNPKQVEDDWVEEYHLLPGDFYIEDVNWELVEKIPTATQMGKVYSRLILQTLSENEDYIQGLIRVYHAEITSIIDDYNTSAYYEPSYILKRAYYAGNFDGV